MGGMSVDEQVLSGLEDFWVKHKDEKKFAAVQFISPHEEAQRQLVNLDVSIAKFLSKSLIDWNDTMLVL